MTHTPESLSAALSELRGRTLSSVEFVHDYLQLHFDGPTLTAYTLPIITKLGETLRLGQNGYRDALCGEIGSVVEAAEAEHDDVTLTFQDGAVVSISVRDQDYRGPEALQLTLDEQRIWVA
ncbi:hypothetical protein [Bryobacter aggregatus]|uniref:hypothetical protein n=1 Tax=Bryobacter aggregatus TaxID=360054 RepID=UPI0012BAF963|nr:hypothetical protein [Bryobacter aggregatus]